MITTVTMTTTIVIIAEIRSAQKHFRRGALGVTKVSQEVFEVVDVRSRRALSLATATPQQVATKADLPQSKQRVYDAGRSSRIYMKELDALPTSLQDRFLDAEMQAL